MFTSLERRARHDPGQSSLVVPPARPPRKDPAADADRRAAPRPRVPGRDPRPPAVRDVRRAHGPLRLHRHLRAGPPDRRRGRLPHRRARARARARPDRRALPGRQLRLRLPLGGRRRPGGGAPAPARPRLAQHRDQRGRLQRVHGLGAQGRARSRSWPSTSAHAGCRRPATCSSTPTCRAAPPSPTSASPTARSSRTTCACGAWATRWTVPGRSATRRPPSTAGSPPRRRARCAWSTLGRARRLRQQQQRHADVRRLGGGDPRAHLRDGRPHLDARLLRGARRRPADLPRLGRRHGPLHHGRRRDRRPRRRPAAQPQEARHLLRRVERLVREGPLRRGEQPRARAGAAPDRGRLQRRPTPSSSATCSSPCCATPTGSRSPARRSSSTSSRRSAPSPADRPGGRRSSTRSRRPRGWRTARCCSSRSTARPTRRRSSARSPSSTRPPPGTRRPGRLSVFAVNRGTTEPLDVVLTLAQLRRPGGGGGDGAGRERPVRRQHRRTTPTASRPARSTRPSTDGALRFTLPPVAWSAVSLTRAGCSPLTRTSPRTLHIPHATAPRTEKERHDPQRTWRHLLAAPVAARSAGDWAPPSASARPSPPAAAAPPARPARRRTSPRAPYEGAEGRRSPSGTASRAVTAPS